MNVLLLGDTEGVKHHFPEDATFYYDEPDLESGYDVIFSSWDLQQRERSEVVDYLKYLREFLANEGSELWVTVPSLEVSAREFVFEDQPGMAAYINVYGTPEKPHRSGFLLVWLRIAMEEAGIKVRKATQEVFTMNIDGKNYPNVQNLAIGIKADDPDPAAAIG